MFRRLVVALIMISVGVDGADGQAARGAAGTPDFGGLVRFAYPADGQIVAPGDSLDFAIEYDGDSPIVFAMVAYPGGALLLENTLRGKLLVLPEWIGPVGLSAIGKTASGSVVGSRNVTINVAVSDTMVFAIELRPPILSLAGPGSVGSVSVVGKYRDGVSRDITDYRTSFETMTGPGIVCVMRDAAVVGRVSGTAEILVTHGGLVDTLRVDVGDASRRNNVPHASLEEMYEARVGDTICFTADGCWDYDACVGEPLVESAYTWTLTHNDVVRHGSGSAFCHRFDESGFGTIMLKVTDAQGDSSMTAGMIVVE